MTSHTFKPDLPAPTTNIGVIGWMRANLFSSWFNTLLTLLGLYLIWLIVPPILEWAIFKADWTGETRADCSREGACWVFVQTRFSQFMYGYYPAELRWRVDAAAWLAIKTLRRFRFTVSKKICGSVLAKSKSFPGLDVPKLLTKTSM